jgi:hypothetical protein
MNCYSCDDNSIVNLVTPYLKEAISALEKHQKMVERQLADLRSLAGHGHFGKRREFSEETRRKMSLAQKRRWKAAKAAAKTEAS